VWKRGKLLCGIYKGKLEGWKKRRPCAKPKGNGLKKGGGGFSPSPAGKRVVKKDKTRDEGRGQ